MQHAVKYRLVPESLLNATPIQPPPPVNRLEEMSRELISILDDPHMERYKKQALFEQLLHRLKTFRDHLGDPIPRRSPPPVLPQPPPDVASAPRVRKPKPVRRKIAHRVVKPPVEVKTTVEDDISTARESESELSTATAISEPDDVSTQESVEDPLRQTVERIRKTQRRAASVLNTVDTRPSVSKKRSTIAERSHKRTAHKTTGVYREARSYKKRSQKGRGGQRFTVRKWTVS